MKKVNTYGSFDLFSVGHYDLLKRARGLGDMLIVGVTDEQLDASRGMINIADSLMRRVGNVRSTGFADEIIIEEHEGQKIEDIEKYGADIFAVGFDWRGEFEYLRQYCEVVCLDRAKDAPGSM